MSTVSHWRDLVSLACQAFPLRSDFIRLSLLPLDNSMSAIISVIGSTSSS